MTSNFRLRILIGYAIFFVSICILRLAINLNNMVRLKVMSLFFCDMSCHSKRTLCPDPKPRPEAHPYLAHQAVLLPRGFQQAPGLLPRASLPLPDEADRRKHQRKPHFFYHRSGVTDCLLLALWVRRRHLLLAGPF